MNQQDSKIYKINWVYCLLGAVLFLIFVGLGVYHAKCKGANTKDLGLLFIFLVSVYVLITSCRGKLTLNYDNMVSWNSSLRKEIEIPYSSITKVERSFFLCAFQYSIYFNIDGKERVEFANIHFHWKDMLRQIYTKVDKNVFDDDVKKKLGITEK
jgi:hypothetical protein